MKEGSLHRMPLAALCELVLDAGSLLGGWRGGGRPAGACAAQTLSVNSVSWLCTLHEGLNLDASSLLGGQDGQAGACAVPMGWGRRARM